MVCYFLTQEAYKAAQEEKIEALKDFKSSTELIPQNMIQKSFRSLRGKVSTTEDKSIRKYKLLPSISSKKIRAKAGEYVTGLWELGNLRRRTSRNS